MARTLAEDASDSQLIYFVVKALRQFLPLTNHTQICFCPPFLPEAYGYSKIVYLNSIQI